MNPYETQGEKEQYIELEIGMDIVYYKIEGSYTYLYNEDYQRLGFLRWAANEKEVTAAFYGYGMGYTQGKLDGANDKVFEIRKSLGLE